MKRNVLSIMLVAVLCCAWLTADVPDPRKPGGNVGRSTFKVIWLYEDDDYEIDFSGNNSSPITAGRSTAIMNTGESGVTIANVQALAPNDEWVTIEDWNDGSTMVIAANSSKRLGLATYPYDQIRIVVTGGASGLYGMGAD
ncbi:hypothetical protein KOR42_05980 [Thalassoglobus neptunius]|uniref:Uncharacterized protein n=1 Tax=Thalassoglobus neptunius TaxID=1938619 RepID=A0A5C5X335_9PLAN|nr:hypothetical protein [Thalassoglobus neptunius]TWT57240.1 hypothetical protein KOR42_05980 [Thalassoglobus neptunius]